MSSQQKNYGLLGLGIVLILALLSAFIYSFSSGSSFEAKNTSIQNEGKMDMVVTRKLLPIPAMRVVHNEKERAPKPLKVRYLPPRIMASNFSSTIEGEQDNLNYDLVDDEYKQKYAEWKAKHGSMENVPEEIRKKFPNGYSRVITDAYSPRFKDATPALLSRARPCDGFDMPVGAPDGKGYYIAQIFGSSDHLGEDWNGRGGGNTDLGDPVYAVADGVVYWSKINKGSWGNIVRLIHNIGTSERPVYIESLYAHLDTILVWEGQEVVRGQEIGTIGDAYGHYPAHLHLEIRKKINTPLGRAYTRDTVGFHYRRPLPFIEKRRPQIYRPDQG